MASLLPANNLYTAINLPCKKTRSYYSQPFKVNAQIHKDHHHEGRSSDMVETNIEVLRVRIEEVKRRERLERCCLAEWGWNYAPLHQSLKAKRDEEMVQFLQLMGMAASTFGLTIFSCTFSLCFMSLLLHLNQ